MPKSFSGLIYIPAIACLVFLALSYPSPAQAVRTVPTQSERGSYFTFPYNDDYAGMGLISFGALNNIYDRMPENGLTLKHARFHHFNSWDATGGHTGFPYFKLIEFNDAEIAAGRPPIMVTATYQGKTRYVYFQSGYPAGNHFQLVDVADDRYIRFFAEEFVYKIAYPNKTTLGPTDYISSDEGMFRPTNYGVFSDSGSFVRFGSSGLVMNDPFWKTPEEYYEDLATFHRRLKELYPDIKIAHNAGSMGDWSYFQKVYEYADGIAHEELPATENGVIVDRDNMYDWWVRHKWWASKNKVANVRIQDINPNNPDLVRTAYISYLMMRGDNYFHNIQSEPTKEINPALLKAIRDQVGDPIGEWDSTLESGRSRGYRLYWRQTTKGMIYLNVSGTTKTVTLPTDKTYFNRSGNQVSSITLSDSQGDYVTFTGDPRPTPTPSASPSPSPSPSPSASPTACPPDINRDGIVDITDYAILSINFLKSPITNLAADINKDNVVDLADYAIMAQFFLKGCY